MAYNPYSAINAIYKLKGQWDNANNAGDTATKNSVAAEAQSYYNQLRSNGYGNIADELTASNYTQAKAINDKWAKMGKTPTRDYLYSLGQSKGMTSGEVDKLIGWDNQTGEVSFGGKKIGTPDTVVDGVSYWSDTSALDNAFNDYISRSGTAPSASQQSSQNSAGVKSKIDELWGVQSSDHTQLSDMYKKEYEDLKNTNPFTTEEAKAILAKYDLAGLQGRDNAAASGSASNGGNIDSYAAANALRQQAALVSQGQDKVLSAYQQRLDNARSILENLGVYQQNNYQSMQNTIGLQQTEAQRQFENSETAKNNETARLSEQAAVSGYTPDEWVVSNNPYMNADGTIKDEYKDTDFAAVMANAKKAGNTNAYNAAATARFYKIMGNYGAYGQYDDGNYIVPGAQRTADYDLTKQQIESAEDVSLGQIQGEKDIANINAKNTLDVLDKQAELQGIDADVTEEQLDSTITSFLNSPYKDLNMSSMYHDSWADTPVSPVYMARTKLKDPVVVQGIVSTLKKAGYKGDELKNKLSSYYRQQAVKILQAENKAVTEENIKAELAEMPIPVEL